MEMLDPKGKHEAGLKYIEEVTTNASQVQQEILEKILAQNMNTEYLSGFLKTNDDTSCVVDKFTFKNKVPIVEYEDIKPYIQRIANGSDPSSHILCAQPITELLTSSGTSGGQPKMMPTTAEDLQRKTIFYNLLVPVIDKYIDGLDKGKGMYLLFVKPEISTPSGLMARPVLTSYYQSSHFKNRTYDPYSVFTSPDDTIVCTDSKQSMYCQLLCGLVQRDQVLRVGAVFASAFLRAIKFLEDHFRELCSNVRTGALSDWITDPGCRNSVSLILGEPNPELANLIEYECTDSITKSRNRGIIKKLWPRTKYIDVIVTGSMAQYIPTLEFYSGGLSLVSTMYGSSECFMGIKSNPYDVSYTILPFMAYFEFLPVNDDHVTNLEEAVDLTDVKIGHQYELVITTFTGLYRYRVGDILMATGFHNKAPKFKLVHRLNVVLSIDTDKTSEEDLLKAVTEAKLQILEPLGFLLTEYTSYADTSSIPGHYVLYWELKTTRQNDDGDDDDVSKLIINKGGAMMEKCCERVEESLDSVYRRNRRRDGSVGALEIRVVKHGTFDVLMDFRVSQGSSVNQYKTPRCIKSEEALKVLESTTLGRFFSKKAPSWEPSFEHI